MSDDCAGFSIEMVADKDTTVADLLYAFVSACYWTADSNPSFKEVHYVEIKTAAGELLFSDFAHGLLNCAACARVLFNWDTDLFAGRKCVQLFYSEYESIGGVVAAFQDKWPRVA